MNKKTPLLSLFGIGIIGLFISDFQRFALPESTYLNPASFEAPEGISQLAWMSYHLAFDSIFGLILAVAFGAGILAQFFKWPNQSDSAKPDKVLLYYLALGLLTMFIFWPIDVLAPLAFLGIILYRFRKYTVYTWLSLATVGFFIPSYLLWYFGATTAYWPPELITHTLEKWQPGQALLHEEIQFMTGSLSEILGLRMEQAMSYLTFTLPTFDLWRYMGMMFIGMTLHKTGFLNGDCKTITYLIFGFLFTCCGMLMTYVGVQKNVAAEWEMTYSMFMGRQFAFWGHLFTAFGYVSLFVLIIKMRRQRLGFFAKAGKAFASIYVSSTILAMLLINVFRLFGQYERQWLFVISISISALMIVLLSLWTKRHSMGPLEMIGQKIWRR